jgi:hypothetical protein
MAPYDDDFSKERAKLTVLVFAGTAIAVVLAFVIT